MNSQLHHDSNKGKKLKTATAMFPFQTELPATININNSRLFLTNNNTIIRSKPPCSRSHSTSIASSHKECTDRPKKVYSEAYNDLVTYARKRDNDRSISPFGSENKMILDAEYLTLTPESCSTRSRSSSIESNPIGSTATPTKFSSSSAYEDLVTIACSSSSSKSDFGSNKHCLRSKFVENRSLCSGPDSDKQTLPKAVTDTSSVTLPTKYRILNKSVAKSLTPQKSRKGSDSTAIIESMPTTNRRVLYVDGGALPCPYYVWKNKIERLNVSKPTRILSIMKKNRYGILEH